jgi:rare lipoprotein A
VSPMTVTGPAGDYPVVLGDPYSVDGQIYTPVDTTSYDEVGYAAPGNLGGAGITAAHKTLPLPSYVEVTSLVTGKTILARVERRGPITGDRLISLSQDAQTQLGSEDGAPVRVRRVNPPEIERAQLRMGQSVSERMETPQSLVAVLKRKLPERGSVNLGSPNGPKAEATATGTTEIAAISVPPSDAVPTLKPVPVTETEPAFDSVFNPEASTPTDYALASVDASTPVVAAPDIAATPQPGPKPKPETTPKRASAGGKFVIQAAAFSTKISAQKVASTLGGFVQPSGKYFRVRVGPFSNRGQADAALAKVRAAGYSDARVSTAG